MLPGHITKICYQKMEGGETKKQIGVRVNSQIWAEFRELCSSGNLKPNEALEAFFKACIEQKSVLSVLKYLKGLNTGEIAKNNINLRRLLTELQAYHNKDAQNKSVKEYIHVSELIKSITNLLPQILDEKLISEAETKISEILAYYHKAFIEAGKSPSDW